MVAIGEDRVVDACALGDHASHAGSELLCRRACHPRWLGPASHRRLAASLLWRSCPDTPWCRPRRPRITDCPRHRSDQVRTPVASDKKRRREHVRVLDIHRYGHHSAHRLSGIVDPVRVDAVPGLQMLDQVDRDVEVLRRLIIIVDDGLAGVVLRHDHEAFMLRLLGRSRPYSGAVACGERECRVGADFRSVAHEED